MKISIYGGGHIAHSIIATISQSQPVNVVTRKPELWFSQVDMLQNGTVIHGKFHVSASSDPSVVSDSDVVFIALPQFAFEEAVRKALPFLHGGQIICFVPAPAKSKEYAELVLTTGANVVAFQRVPFIARTIEYGKSVAVSAPRQELALIISDAHIKKFMDACCNTWFRSNTRYLSSFLIAAFSNSNPLLHPSRLVELFKDWDGSPYESAPLFYADWTDESSKLYISADREMASVMRCYKEIDFEHDYRDVLSHYGVENFKELTQKIRSIPAFKTIKSPMCQQGKGWVPDFASRYFTEDVPYGTRTIMEYARRVGVKTPTIDFLIQCVETLSRRS